MKRYSILLLLLGITICLLAIDQYNQSVGRMPSSAGMSATPTAGQHRNTDFPKSGTPSKPGQRVDSLTHQVEAYRLPVMSVAAQRLMQNPGSGVRLDVSDDGFWLIVWHRLDDAHRNEPRLRQNMEHVKFQKSLATATTKDWNNK